MDRKLVKDLMLPLSDYATIGSDRTIREALAALSKAQLGLTNDRHHHRAVLVLDDKRAVVGKLTHWAMLRSLQPRVFNDADYATLFRSGLSVDFIQSVASHHPVRGSFRHMCRLAGEVKVRDAMVPVKESVAEDAPLVSAIGQMTGEHVQSLLVTRGGVVVGILRLSDVFEEVADLIRTGVDCAAVDEE